MKKQLQRIKLYQRVEENIDKGFVLLFFIAIITTFFKPIMALYVFELSIIYLIAYFFIIAPRIKKNEEKVRKEVNEECYEKINKWYNEYIIEVDNKELFEKAFSTYMQDSFLETREKQFVLAYNQIELLYSIDEDIKEIDAIYNANIS